MLSHHKKYAAVLLAIAAIATGFVAERAGACPFCSAVSQTFSEEIAQSDVAVIAKLVQKPAVSDKTSFNSLDSAKAKFEVVDVVKGEKALGKEKKFEAIYFGENPVGTLFLVMGVVESPNLNWSTPIPISERGRDYIVKAMSLPKEGADRLAYFQDYLEDKDDILSRDAYDEFAKAPYSAVRELKPRMKHDQLLTWIKDSQVPASRRRLYLTMLGVCGTADDGPALEAMMKSKDRAAKAGLDALIASYLTLTGPSGMPQVEDLFLKNKDAEYTDTYAAVMALRFHGQEEKIIPRERLIEGLRHMLSRPQLADLVIPDLARWNDWGSMDQLVKLYKESDDDTSWVRVPVIQFLRACPLPIAKTHLEEIAKLDPETMKRANTFFPFGGAPAPASKDKDKEKSSTTSEKPVAEPSAKTPAAEADKPSASVPAKAPTLKKAKDAKAEAKTGVKTSEHRIGEQRTVAQAGKAFGAAKGSQGATTAISARRVVGTMALASAVLLVLFTAILRGGQQVVNVTR